MLTTEKLTAEESWILGALRQAAGNLVDVISDTCGWLPLGEGASMRVNYGDKRYEIRRENNKENMSDQTKRSDLDSPRVEVPTPIPHNTTYVISIGAPLLRPGMTITAGPVSERYVTETAKRLMDKVREINK